MTQQQCILSDLLAGKKITQRYIAQKYDCYRLSGRILDLRLQGYNIITELKPNKNGGQHAEYSLIKEQVS